MDPAGEPGEGVPAVGSANWNGGMAVARHLLQLGHRRIGLIGGPPDLLCSRARLDGYRAAMDMAGIAIDPALVRSGDFHVEGGRAAGLALLRLPEPPTAVFAGSDLQALGVYEAARELGVRIPEELSVVGYDDLPVARWVGPPLTTVHQPLAEMAEMAARMVITMSRGAAPVTRRLDLATSLVVRQSTASPSPS
jgi:LacI family xylobiose transport system transcriptional regulator